MSIKLKGSTDGSVTLQAPADTSPSGSDKTLTLPTTVGSANQFVKNGGTAGELEYSSMVETSTGDVQARRARSNTAGDVALSVQPSDSTIHYGLRIDSTNNSLNLDRASGTAANLLTIDSSGLISQGGRVASNHGSPNLLLWGADSTLHITSTGSTNNSSYAGIKFAVAGGSTGDYSKAGIFVERQDSYNDLDMLFAFRSSNDATGVSPSDEKMRIDSDGRLLIGTTVGAADRIVHASNSGSNAAYFHSTNGSTGTGASDGVVMGMGDATNAYFWNYESGSIQFATSSSPRMTIASNGNVSIGTTAANAVLNVYGGASATLYQNSNTGTGSGDGFFVGNWGGQSASVWQYENDIINFGTNNTERMRLTSGTYPALQIGKTDFSANAAGTSIGASGSVQGFIETIRDGGTVLTVGRLTNDGKIVSIRQGSSEEGTITVSGSTVSYNGGHLARWSQLASGAARTEILRGSVLSNLDEMCEWGEEDNEQLNRMKVSDVEGDVNVSGVFQAWDDDDDTYTNDFYCAMTGDFVIRIAQGTTVARGDLLMSAGDGTAKPQDDDIVRSKTIAKVTSTTVSTTYSDGSYCVPCVLMAC